MYSYKIRVYLRVLVAVAAALWGLMAVLRSFNQICKPQIFDLLNRHSKEKKKSPTFKGHAPLCGLSSKEVAVTEVHWPKWMVVFEFLAFASLVFLARCVRCHPSRISVLTCGAKNVAVALLATTAPPTPHLVCWVCL